MNIKKKLRGTTLDILGRLSDIKPGVHILAGHYVSRKEKPALVFKKLLKKLSNQADLIDIEEAVRLQLSSHPIRDKLVAFTFDDGFEECHTKLSPVLNDFEVSAAFFIIPEFVDNTPKITNIIRKERLSNSPKFPMTKSQIKDLVAAGHIIGGHTYSHLRLDSEKDDFLRKEIIKCKTAVELISGTSCDYFAWPYGDYKSASAKALALMSENYRVVFASEKNKSIKPPFPNILNRRHFEGEWPFSHIKYFLS